MNLLTLNLHKSLIFFDTESKISFYDAMKKCNESTESSEMLLSWAIENILSETKKDDAGPRTKKPFPMCDNFCISSNEVYKNEVQIQAKRYLFAQTRMPVELLEKGKDESANWLSENVEWFLREAWWTEAKTTGNFFVRLVREDNKTAVQFLHQLII